MGEARSAATSVHLRVGGSAAGDDSTGKQPLASLSGAVQPAAADPLPMDALASVNGMQSFFDALRRTSSVSNLPASAEDFAEENPPGLLNTIADQGSTAWMGMPDDVVGFATASKQEQNNPGRKQSSRVGRSSSLPAPPTSSSGKVEDSCSGRDASGGFMDYHDQLADLRSELHVRPLALTACVAGREARYGRRRVRVEAILSVCAALFQEADETDGRPKMRGSHARPELDDGWLQSAIQRVRPPPPQPASPTLSPATAVPCSSSSMAP